jgi:RecB family endonuclease NucS
MENLFLKNNEGIRILSPEEFKIEESLENMIFNTPELLKDIFQIKRQVRAGNKILDILGIDKKNGDICIIEIKNTKVDEQIILQIAKYASGEGQLKL